MSIRWLPEHEQFVRDNHGKMSFGEIAARLGMTRSQVSGKADRLGLSTGVPRHQRKTNLPRRKTVFTITPPPKYEEPMPQLEGDQKLHSRPWGDLWRAACATGRCTRNRTCRCTARRRPNGYRAVTRPTARAMGRWGFSLAPNASTSTGEGSGQDD